jgi:hypothetical protein
MPHALRHDTVTVSALPVSRRAEDEVVPGIDTFGLDLDCPRSRAALPPLGTG